MVSINWIINTHKILVIPVVLELMWHFHNWSAPAFLYLGLHGTYSLLWLIKQAVFPDKRFAQPTRLWVAVFTPFLPLMAYMIGSYLLISEYTLPPNWVFAAGTFLVILGVFLHYVSDAQKFFALQLRRGLIVDGLFSRTRNPNYLGEGLIYAGFAIVSWHWQAAVVLAAWFLYYLRNMRQKDKSLSRYPEFSAYKERTGILLPAVHSSAGTAPKTRFEYKAYVGTKKRRPVRQIRESSFL
jgi:protein-S-isoprenylcysteine O-methyltransferase Ste14